MLVAHSYTAFCDPMDCSQSGSSVPGILQARILEWVVIPFSRDLPNAGMEPGLLHCRQILNHCARGAWWIVNPAYLSPSLEIIYTHSFSFFKNCWLNQLFSFTVAPRNIRDDNLKKSFQFSSVTQSCPTLCNTMDYSMPGIPVHHPLLEPTQTHVYWVGDAIQPSHPLSAPSPAFNFSQHQGLFKWVSSLHQVAKVLEFQLQHQLTLA